MSLVPRSPFLGHARDGLQQAGDGPELVHVDGDEHEHGVAHHHRPEGLQDPPPHVVPDLGRSGAPPSEVIHIHTHTYPCVWVDLCVCGWICVCVCVWVDLCVCVCVWVDLRVWVCVCVWLGVEVE